MATPIVNTVIELGRLVVPVSVCSAAERKEATLDRAYPVCNKQGKVTGYKHVSRIDVPSPDPDEETLTVDPVRRDKNSKVIQAQYDGELARGKWIDEATFQEISPADLEAINEETAIDSIVIDSFMPTKDIPWERITGAYFLLPQKGTSAKALVLLHKALRKKRAAGVTKIAFRAGSPQKLAVIHAVNGGLMINTLRFTEEMHHAEREMQLEPVLVSSEMVSFATQAIDQRMSVGADVLDTFHDEALAKRHELVEAALAGKGVRRTERKPVTATVPSDDVLIETLRASVKRVRSTKPAAPVA